MGHQRSTNGMRQPGHQPQHGIKARNGVGRSQERGFIIANQQQNTGLDPRRQQHAPQKLNAPGLPISFHYPPQDPHSTPRTRTAITGSIRLLPRHPQPPPQIPLHGKDRCTTPTLDTNEGPDASAVSSVHKFVAGSFLKSGGRKCRRRG